MIRAILFALFVLLPGRNFAHSEATPGDINRDGNVDFQDFILFSRNFGKTGDPPEPEIPDTVRITIRDTVKLTVRDTVRLTVRDTVYLVEGESDRYAKARRMIGLWLFDTTFEDEYFSFGQIQSENSTAVKPGEDQLLILGGYHLGVLAVAQHYKSTDYNNRYLILWRLAKGGAQYSLHFTLNNQDKPINGQYYSKSTPNSSLVKIADIRTTGSGKGFYFSATEGFRYHASKVAPPNLDSAPPEAVAEHEALFQRMIELE